MLTLAASPGHFNPPVEKALRSLAELKKSLDAVTADVQRAEGSIATINQEQAPSAKTWPNWKKTLNSTTATLKSSRSKKMSWSGYGNNWRSYTTKRPVNATRLRNLS